MSISNIEEIAEITGVDLSPALEPLTRIDNMWKLIGERKNDTEQLAEALAIQATASSTPEEFHAKWDEAQRMMLAATANRVLYEPVFQSLHRKGEKMRANAPWDALTLLEKHVAKLAREFTKLPLDALTDAETAIKHGSSDQYTRANEIANTLEQINELPELERRTPRMFVTINPPDLPEARVNGELNLAKDHTEQEIALITQAATLSRQDSFYMQLLTAARNGWEIKAATNPAEVTERYTRFRQAAYVSDGLRRIAVKH